MVNLKKVKTLNLLFAVVLVSMTACKKDNDSDNNPSNAPKQLPCSITSNTTLTDHNPNGVDYIVNCYAEVISGTLTIEAGVSIEFKPTAQLFIKPQGAIVCVGTPTKPILMKGTINQPSWNGLIIESTTPLNELAYTIIENAGTDINFQRLAGLNRIDFVASVGVYGRLKMQHTTISGSKGVGFICSGEAKIDAFANNTIKGCTESPMVIHPPQCNQMTLNSCVFTGNNSNYIELYGVTSNESVEEATIIKEATIPYLVSTNLDCTNSLTIEAGAKLVFQSGKYLVINGKGASIKANGTPSKPIIMQGEQPLKGLWGGIYVTSENVQNVLTSVYISEGGSEDFSISGAVDLRGNILLNNEGRLTLNNCRSTNFEGCAVYNDGGILINNSPEIPNSSICQ
jgi:hypothetical protein